LIFRRLRWYALALQDPRSKGRQRVVTGSNGATSTGSIKVLFLGQCLQYGYANVSKSATFADLAASMLRVRFPGLSFKFDYKYLYHPAGLKTILKHRLLLTRPDVALINLPAMYAARSWRVNLVYEIAPELVDTARSFMQKIEGKVRGDNKQHQATMLDKVFAVRRPITIEEYETLVEDAVRDCKSASSCRIVLMGPGRFNDDTIEEYAVHSPELWSSVNRMVLRVGQRLDVPVIDVHEALAEYGGEVFTPSNHRWSVYGHEIMAREVEAVLASQVAELSRNQVRHA
jgi:hypothetical protein